MSDVSLNLLDTAKFRDPQVTAKGEPRAHVALKRLETLWFNTGTLCNIACEHCYIESSPTNDRLAYLTAVEVSTFLDEIERERLGTRQIGFTGGEPFMNRDLIAMIEDAGSRGFEILVLTNAMRPMMNRAAPLLDLHRRLGPRLTLRVSIDHYRREWHERERGLRSWGPMIEGLRWLAEHGFHIDVAGRTCWDEDEASLRRGYAELFREMGVRLDAFDPKQLILFPEMDEQVDVPEITTGCWDILGLSPDSVMCASSRMVVKRKGAIRPVVLACTIIPYDPRFELGHTLAEVSGRVMLNHPHCAKFCVLGGGSCSA